LDTDYITTVYCVKVMKITGCSTRHAPADAGSARKNLPGSYGPQLSFSPPCFLSSVS
jgi:hypothetical protein